MKHDRVDPDWFHDELSVFDFKPNDDRVIKESLCDGGQGERDKLVLDVFASLYDPIDYRLIESTYRKQSDVQKPFLFETSLKVIILQVLVILLILPEVHLCRF